MNRGQKKRILTNNTFFSSVVESTSRYLGGRVLLPNERNELSKYIRQIDLSRINNRRLAIDKVARGFAARVVRSNRSVDTHEILKKQINTISSDEKTEYNMDCGPVYPTDNKTRYSRTNYQYENQNNNDMSKVLGMLETLTTRTNVEIPMRLENKALPFNSTLHKYPNIAKQRIQTMHLLLDSKYRNLSTDDSTFKWTLTRSQNTTQGSVNSLVDQIHNVISIQFEKFHIPTYTDTNNYEKVSLFIEEFGSTSVLLNNGGRYHMLFDVVQDGTLRKELIPAIHSEGEFKFHTPINTIDNITITFRNPFLRINFEPDRYEIKIIKGNPTTLRLSSTAHNVQSNDYIYITGFSTNDSADDTIVSTINRESGHIVTYTPPASGGDVRDLTIAEDTSGISGTMNFPIGFIQSRRIFIPMRLQYIVE